MALQLSLTDPATQAVYPNCYVRVSRPPIIHSRNTVYVTVSEYATAAAASAGADPIRDRGPLQLNQAEVDALWLTFQTAIYTMLKARPEYSGATDV